MLESRFLPFRGWGKTVASDTVSWFGPLAVPLVIAVGIVASLRFHRGYLPRLALVLAAAPLAWFVLLALTLGYDITQGRFFIFPVALSASLWGLVLRVDRYAAAAVAVALTTAGLTLVNYLEKPSGLRLLDGEPAPTMWGMERWEAAAVSRPERKAYLRLISEVPADATVALAFEFNDFGYIAFGPHLERQVELVPFGSGARTSQAEWLVANPRRARQIDRDCWLEVRATRRGWTKFKRRPTGTCRA